MSEPGFVLHTPRLCLRPLTAEDVDALVALYGDPEVAKSLLRLPSPYTIAVAHGFIDEARATFASRSGYVLATFERTSRIFVGVTSLRILPPETSPDGVVALADDPLGILGYAIARAQWGLGFASEAAGRLAAFAFDELELDRLQASVLRDNPASKRVLEHLGFTQEEAGLLEQPLSGGPPRLVDRYGLARGNQVDTGDRARSSAE